MLTSRDLEASAVAAIKHQVQIPRGLELAMDTNPQLKKTLMPTVLEAVRLSFEDPATAMRVLGAGEIKQRVGVCLEAMRVMYCEQNLSLHQCYSCLRKVLSQSLLLARRAEDLAAAGQRPGIYGTEAPKQQVEVELAAPDINAGASVIPEDES